MIEKMLCIIESVDFHSLDVSLLHNKNMCMLFWIVIFLLRNVNPLLEYIKQF